jgi:rubrerythrin
MIRSTKTAAQCLRSAMRMETLAQELYAGLATTYSHQPWLRDLFEQLAAEEGQHAMRIRLLDRHQGQAPWPPEMVLRVWADLDAMSEAIAAMKVEFRKPSVTVDAPGVLQRLVDMELRFGSVHAEELARSTEPAIQKLFSSLAVQDSRHRELIKKALLRVAA